MNSSSTPWAYGGEMGGGGISPWALEGRRSTSTTISKVQHQYWVTKETVLRKLGKKEDEHVVASDAELDAKLELFRSIQDSCLDLQRIIDRYQERICFLAQEENGMGRFLKEAGKADKTGAGSLMISLGKAMSVSGQQRIALRAPLLRLYQEVDTFRGRAIEDTQRTVGTMERARTKYRASLSWMKDVSQSLDPDTYSQLDKFKKVQLRVKANKGHFDRYKRDTLEKVDLLAAARCNMFSHALSLYHSGLLQFATASATAYQGLADVCAEHRHYEFTVVKELSELRPETSPTAPASSELTEELSTTPADSDDKLLDFDDLEPPPAATCWDKDKDGMSGDGGGGSSASAFLPSQLLLNSSQGAVLTSPESGLFQDHPPLSEDEGGHLSKPTLGNTNSKLKNSWLDLFSELDPLSNPDTLGGGQSGEPFGDC